MIRHVTDNLEYIGPSPTHVRDKPSVKDMMYGADAKECLYSLLGTVYIPEDIARRMTQTYADATGGMPVTIQTVVYKGDCYVLMHAADCYGLCIQLVCDFFPRYSRVRQLMIRSYTILIEECEKDDA